MGSSTNNSTMVGSANNVVKADFARKRHAQYFMRFLKLLPARLSSHDSNRVTIAFFAVSGLDVLDCLDLLTEQQRGNIINWVYRYQVTPAKGRHPKCGGFVGSSSINVKESDEGCGTEMYKWGHLAMTYLGIAILLALGDDLSRLDRKAIIEGVAATQKPDGSFSASVEGTEHDMRFVYCAACICAMLDDWGTVDKAKMRDYILRSVRYDYGISQHYEMESHGGTTFCAIAALDLSGQLADLPLRMREGMKRWLIMRQLDGFQGRPNKIVDTCYAFWIGSALKILDAFHLTDFEENRRYVISTQDSITGGFGKWPGSNSDPFHTYFGICGLSFLNEPGTLDVMPSLNISMRSYERMKLIHQNWRLQNRIADVRIRLD